MIRGNVAVFVPHLGCPHRCSFCNQREISGTLTVPSPEDVRKTARGALEKLGKAAANSEIAFFGGSFTAIKRGLMVSLLKAAGESVGPGLFKGIRISTRPDAIDSDTLEILKEYGVSAVELGAQSMDDRVLELNGRGHTAADVTAASNLIKSAGIELGLQMMTGLYGDTEEGILLTAGKIAELHPATVRVYPTIVVKNTSLERLYRRGDYKPQSLEEAVGLCSKLLEFFHVKNIRVIRLGLHSEKSLIENYVAGPWHPAFRELCESRLYYKRACEALSGLSGDAVLYVGEGEVSKLTGQRRENIKALEKAFGAKLKIKALPGLEKYTVKAQAVQIICGDV